MAARKKKAGSKSSGKATAKKGPNFMEEQRAQDEKDSVSEQLGKHVTQMWDLVRECEHWTKAARSTASAPMKVHVAKRVSALASTLSDECASLLKFAKRRGLDK